MTNIEIINEEISELERSAINYQVAEKLAWLYIVRDHMPQESTDTNNAPAVVVSRETPATQEQMSVSTSEFVTKASGVNKADLLDTLDEHMDVIKAIYPKEYAAIIEKIESLK